VSQPRSLQLPSPVRDLLPPPRSHRHLRPSAALPLLPPRTSSRTEHPSTAAHSQRPAPSAQQVGTTLASRTHHHPQSLATRKSHPACQDHPLTQDHSIAYC
ncbi:hypothetical protein HN51_012189, partial [Arachis hypogaea]